MLRLQRQEGIETIANDYILRGTPTLIAFFGKKSNIRNSGKKTATYKHEVV